MAARMVERAEFLCTSEGLIHQLEFEYEGCLYQVSNPMAHAYGEPSNLELE
jgi:hypothetical protein